MTNEEAIKILKGIEMVGGSLPEDGDLVEEALLMAIKALEQEPCEGCRNCKKWDECPCGKEGHKNGTSIGYSIGECKEYEPCEDCISREDALNAVNSLTEIHDSDIVEKITTLNNIDWIKMKINEIPSVTPQQTRWIPVTERLPKAYEFVNCTCHSLIDDREDWVIETVYIPQPSDSPYSDWGNIPMLNSGDCKVVAWMHRDIPEPYKAESEGFNG